MIERKYKILELYNGEKDLVVLFNIKNYEVLGSFFYSDVIPFEDWIKADFDKVISGESQYEEVNGNVCHVEICTIVKRVDTFFKESCLRTVA